MTNATPPDSALSLLQEGQICELIIRDGSHREGAWTSWNRGWHYTDGKGNGFAHVSEVEEWWPAGVPF